MNVIQQFILSAYPAEFRGTVYPLRLNSSLGSHRHWEVNAPTGTYCLRRWARGKPSLNRLQFIQALIWYTVCEGIDFVPLPLETLKHHGYVEYDGSYWEMLPWIDNANAGNAGIENTSGQDHFLQQAFRIASAMIQLAQFHSAASTFPLPDYPLATSQTVQNALEQWQYWLDGHLELLAAVVLNQQRAEIGDTEIGIAENEIALRTIRQMQESANDGLAQLRKAATLAVTVQSVIGNASQRHLRFDDHGVEGILDLTKIRVDSVALDIATLLGSMTAFDSRFWHYGLKAYQKEHSITENELFLIETFQQTLPLLESLGYLADIYLRNRPLNAEQRNEIFRRIRKS